MMKIAFTILGKPVSHKNSYHIVTIKGRSAIVRSKEALAYERDALRQIHGTARQRLEGPVRVSMWIYYENERPDLDESMLLDVMQDWWGKMPNPTGSLPAARVLIQGGVYRNDRQVREKHVYHRIDRANPRIEVEIEPMTPQQQGLPQEIFDEAEVKF